MTAKSLRRRFRIFLSSGCYIAELVMRYPFCDTQYLATWLRARRSRKDNHEARLAHSPPDPSDWIRTLEGKTASVPSGTEYSLHCVANVDRQPAGKDHVGFT